MRPKADGGVAPARADRGADLGLFVLFSSVAGVLGQAGQGNYAAANAFLDALAAFRRAAGWRAVAGVGAVGAGRRDGGRLGAADRERMAREGITALAPRDGLALFDAGRWAAPEALLVAARLDVAGCGRAAARRRCRRCCRAWPRPGAARAGRPRPARRRWPPGWPGLLPPSGGGWCWTWCWRRWRRCWGTVGRGGRGRAVVPRAGVRLADRGGAAEPAECGDRAAAAGHPGVRLPDPGGAGGFMRARCSGEAGRGGVGRGRGGGRGGGRSGGDRGDGVPVPWRGGVARGPVGAGGVGDGCGVGVPG